MRTNALQSGLAAFDAASLTEIARLMPEVLATQSKLPRPVAMTEGWQRQHFFEALARALLCARQPLLLLLDDLQWCDHETLEWLQYLLRFEPGARMLLIGTVRTEEILPGHPLVAFLRALQRDGLMIEIPLGSLTRKETTFLAEHILSRQLDAAMSATLFAETEGNPLFVVEMARAGPLGLNGRIAIDAKSPRSLLMQADSVLPSTVQSVLAARLTQFSPLAHEVANVAAVIGREFVFSVLVQASGQGEDAVVRGLDELWQRRLVREHGTGIAEVYDFSHDKLSEQVYNSLSPAPRRLLHRRVATAFEEVYESFAVTGNLQEARQAYQRARSTLPPQESVWQARLQRKTASTWNQASANPHDTFPINAQQAFEEAERILAHAADQTSPAWRHEWIDLQFVQVWPLRGSEDDMTAMIEKVRPIIEQYGTQEQRELLSYALATRELIRARYVISDQRIAVLRKVVAAVQQTGNKSKPGILHMTFGITLLSGLLKSRIKE